MSGAHEQGDYYDDAPGARHESALEVYKGFERELDERADSIESMLPSTVTLARFRNIVIAAVRQDPTILSATRRSLMAAVTRAAQDGLVPDGREGHISVYNTNVAGKNQPAKWEKRAQWNPMAAGLRKRLRELDGIIANAEPVHKNDHFIWEQGDDPKIEHRPAFLGTDRGSIIGAYCIYKREDGTILHREVMDTEQIETTRKQSKAPDSLMWTKFQSEGYRKAVLRRGIKTVPVSDTMREIVQRDDETNFDFAGHHSNNVVTLTPPPAPLPTPPEVEHKQGGPMPSINPMPDSVEAELDRKTMRAMENRGAPVDELADWLSDRIAEAERVKSMATLDELDEQVCRELDAAGRDELRARWNATYGTAKVALGSKRK